MGRAGAKERLDQSPVRCGRRGATIEITSESVFGVEASRGFRAHCGR